jgi:transcriptional regulator with XRE-family HTH domain
MVRGMTGAELKWLRTRAGLTQKALAARLGLTANHVAQLERGEVRIREVVALAARTVTAPRSKGGRHRDRETP